MSSDRQVSISGTVKTIRGSYINAKGTFSVTNPIHDRLLILAKTDVKDVFFSTKTTCFNGQKPFYKVESYVPLANSYAKTVFQTKNATSTVVISKEGDAAYLRTMFAPDDHRKLEYMNSMWKLVFHQNMELYPSMEAYDLKGNVNEIVFNISPKKFVFRVLEDAAKELKQRGWKNQTKPDEDGNYTIPKNKMNWKTFPEGFSFVSTVNWEWNPTHMPGIPNQRVYVIGMIIEKIIPEVASEMYGNPTAEDEEAEDVSAPEIDFIPEQVATTSIEAPHESRPSKKRRY